MASETGELNVDALKTKLGELQELLLDAPEGKRKVLKKQVRDVKMALKIAVRAYKNDDGVVSECSSVTDRFDIDKMKRDLAHLGEAQMAAASSEERKELKAKVRTLKKALSVAVSQFKGGTSETGSVTSAQSAEEQHIDKIKAELPTLTLTPTLTRNGMQVELALLQEFLMSAPPKQRQELMAQIRGVKKTLQIAVANFKEPGSEEPVATTSGATTYVGAMGSPARPDGALVAVLREEKAALEGRVVAEAMRHEEEVARLTQDLHAQKAEQSDLVSELRREQATLRQKLSDQAQPSPKEDAAKRTLEHQLEEEREARRRSEAERDQAWEEARSLREALQIAQESLEMAEQAHLAEKEAMSHVHQGEQREVGEAAEMLHSEMEARPRPT